MTTPTAKSRNRLDWSIVAVGFLFWHFVDLTPIAWFLGFDNDWVVVVCSLANGALAGVAFWGLAPSSIEKHAVALILLVGLVKLVFALTLGLFIGTGLMVTFAMHHVPWIVGAVVMGMILRVSCPANTQLRHVSFPGVGDAWEPEPRRKLANYFCGVVLLAFALETYSAVENFRISQVAVSLINEMHSQSGLQREQTVHSIRENLNTADKESVDRVINQFRDGYFHILFNGSVLARFLGCLGLVALVKRCYPISASAILATPGSSFMWLRPFDADGLPEGVPRRRDLILNPWKSLVGRTIEQKINKCFLGFSGFIAIGRPGERLPPLGAARLYVSDDQWQKLVFALMQHCSGIILHATKNHGTLWEWQNAFATQERSRVIMFVPIRGSSPSQCNKNYQSIKHEIETQTGVLLPDQWQRTNFAFFESNDSPQATWLSRSTRIPSNHPLTVVLARLARIKFIGKAPVRGPGCLIFLLVILAVLVILLVIAHLKS